VGTLSFEKCTFWGIFSNFVDHIFKIVWAHLKKYEFSNFFWKNYQNILGIFSKLENFHYFWQIMKI
jgi:hypothetical protein